MNVVMLIGNLATDVEIKDVGEDKRVANFLLAVNRRTKDGGADFFRVTVWDKQAEHCAQYLVKGKRVGVEGHLRSSAWEQDGATRRQVEVVARSVQFLSPPSEPAAAEVVPFEAAGAAR
ncbi:MAG: single-stranded DNA-binding protein [Acidobacteria bacterium]|jgi:single-strand DNA-binding protein|nr:single-stranded DNA-binding protein [Acidobacteriota bacterium]